MGKVNIYGERKGRRRNRPGVRNVISILGMPVLRGHVSFKTSICHASGNVE